jgi:hypothetical protein
VQEDRKGRSGQAEDVACRLFISPSPQGEGWSAYPLLSTRVKPALLNRAGAFVGAIRICHNMA